MKQVVVDVRGAAYHDQDAPLSGTSVPAMKQEVFPYVAFRLVRDDSDRFYYGGNWRSAAVCARDAYHSVHYPDGRGDNRGLRLVHDREDT